MLLWLVVALLGLIPFGGLLYYNQGDVWMCQALIASQGACLLLTRFLWQTNRPLAAWVAWTGLSSLWWMHQVTQLTSQLDGLTTMALLHFVSILIVYAMFVHLTNDQMTIVLRWVARSGVVMMAYALMQYVNLDEFYHNVDDHTRSVFGGTFGNETHLGTYLAFLLPIFLVQPHWRWKLLAVLNTVLVVLTHSRLALGCEAVIWQGYLCLTSWWGNWVTLLSGSAGIWWILHQSIDWHGRMLPWQNFWSIYAQNKPITGLGSSFIFRLVTGIQDIHNPLFQWHHVHNEFFQVALEYGVVGLVIVLWAFWDWLMQMKHRVRTRNDWVCITLFFVFLCSAQVNYPAHLWGLGVFGLLGYAGGYRNEQPL